MFGRKLSATGVRGIISPLDSLNIFGASKVFS
jgi:hypothetical protein